MNSPIPPREILKYPDDINKRTTVESILKNDEYISKALSLLENNVNCYMKSQFLFNVDEEGHEDFEDAPKKADIIVNNELLLADETFLKPMIIIKRSTINVSYFLEHLADKLIIEHEENGYINGELFDYWASNVLFPHIQEQRNVIQYSGPAAVLLDGCARHYTETFFRLSNNVKLLT